MSAELDQLDRRLLDEVQRSVPLVPRPFAQLAVELRVDEGQVIARVSGLSGPGGVIREIAGIFDAAALGYATTLVAARCAPGRLDRAGRIVAESPGVSHCYGREGELNLWFTLSVPPESDLGLNRTIDRLGEMIGAKAIFSLPAVRRYKLDVRFNMAEGGERGPFADPGTSRHAAPLEQGPSREQVRGIRALQVPLPAAAEPFAPLAAEAGMSVDDLLVRAADFLSAGWMRRYAAVLRHRLAGAAANVLVAWQVPEGRVDAFGRQAGQFAAVSHCYLRAARADWPYKLYTMVHGGDRDEVAGVIQSVAAAGGDFPRVELPTTTEYKKAKLQLFSPAFARWEGESGS